MERYTEFTKAIVAAVFAVGAVVAFFVKYDPNLLTAVGVALTALAQVYGVYKFANRSA